MPSSSSRSCSATSWAMSRASRSPRGCARRPAAGTRRGAAAPGSGLGPCPTRTAAASSIATEARQHPAWNGPPGRALVTDFGIARSTVGRRVDRGRRGGRHAAVHESGTGRRRHARWPQRSLLASAWWRGLRSPGSRRSRRPARVPSWPCTSPSRCRPSPRSAPTCRSAGPGRGARTREGSRARASRPAKNWSRRSMRCNRRSGRSPPVIRLFHQRLGVVAMASIFLGLFGAGQAWRWWRTGSDLDALIMGTFILASSSGWSPPWSAMPGSSCCGVQPRARYE